jgi:ABC-type transporter Mla MlaB component
VTRYEPFAIEALTTRPPTSRLFTDASKPDSHAHTVRLRVFGELDDDTRPELVGAVAASARSQDLLPARMPVPAVELDLSRLGFCDLAGASALGEARAALQLIGWGLCVSGPGRTVLRLLDVAIFHGWLPADLECPQRPWLILRATTSQRVASTDLWIEQVDVAERRSTTM